VSLSCANSLVENNDIKDATDAGIVIFGSPGSTVRNNTISATDVSKTTTRVERRAMFIDMIASELQRVMLGGINSMYIECQTNAMIRLLTVSPVQWSTLTRGKEIFRTC
jgi:parallel beta-helix repeat protein